MLLFCHISLGSMIGSLQISLSKNMFNKLFDGKFGISQITCKSISPTICMLAKMTVLVLHEDDVQDIFVEIISIFFYGRWLLC